MIKILVLLSFLPILAMAEELRVMSWNTYLLPPPWNTTQQKIRTKVMVEVLPNLPHDVMLFQETFYDKKRNDLIRSLTKFHPYIAIPIKGKKLKHLQDSGLFVASRYPMEMLDQVIFTDCFHADCLSSKTAMLVEITLPSGKKLQMINTHLQAAEEPKAVAIRTKQLELIKKMMSKNYRKGVPQILTGDLNIDGNSSDPEYANALKQMEMTSTPIEGELKSTNGFSTVGCFKKTGDNLPQWLDHFWLKENESNARIEQKKVFPVKGKINKQDCPLSDHYSLEAVILL